MTQFSEHLHVNSYYNLNIHTTQLFSLSPGMALEWVHDWYYPWIETENYLICGLSPGTHQTGHMLLPGPSTEAESTAGPRTEAGNGGFQILQCSLCLCQVPCQSSLWPDPGPSTESESSRIAALPLHCGEYL